MRRVAPITNVFRRHWPFALVVAAAAIVRVGVAVAYRPALFYSDSWAYVDRTWCCRGVAFTPYPPSGYPALMQLLSPVGRQLAVITSAQHVAGLLVGVILYALLLRAGVNRVAAALAAAVVLLDAYSIALEQHIMAEPFFTLALTASAYFATDPRRVARAIAASGLLLGAAVTMRAAALFAIPVWLAYILWTYRRPRLVATAAVCLAVPLSAYAVAGAVEGYPFDPVRSFALSGGNTGWALYGRVGSIADCNGRPHSPRDPIALPAGRAAPPLVFLLPVEPQITGTPSIRLDLERALQRFAQGVCDRDHLRPSGRIWRIRESRFPQVLRARRGRGRCRLDPPDRGAVPIQRQPAAD